MFSETNFEKKGTGKATLSELVPYSDWLSKNNRESYDGNSTIQSGQL